MLRHAHTPLVASDFRELLLVVGRQRHLRTRRGRVWCGAACGTCPLAARQGRSRLFTRNNSTEVLTNDSGPCQNSSQHGSGLQRTLPGPAFQVRPLLPGGPERVRWRMRPRGDQLLVPEEPDMPRRHCNADIFSRWLPMSPASLQRLEEEVRQAARKQDTPRVSAQRVSTAPYRGRVEWRAADAHDNRSH